MDTYTVKYAGICGSDINKIRKKDFDISKIPFYGHEIVCSDNNGMLYVVNPFICDSDCNNCDCGSLLYCERASRLGDGNIGSGFSGEISVPPENLYEMSSCNYPQIGVLCDGIAVVLHGLHMIDATHFSRVAIIGSGSIGVLTALVLKDYNPHISIDILVRSREKQEYLRSNYSKYFSVVDYCELDHYNECYDLVVEAVGGNQTSTISSAITMVEKNGTILVFGAFDAACNSLQEIRTLFFKQIHLLGANSFCRVYNDFDVAVKWAINHEEILYPIITHQISISRKNYDVMQLYQGIINNKTLKDCFVYES